MNTDSQREMLTLALFFTRGVSLKRWDEVGNLSREIALYNELAPHLRRIYFFTYGSSDDLRYQDRLAGNIVVVPKLLPLPSLLYMLALPFLTRKYCREADVYKTNQMKGGFAAMIAKRLYRKKLIVRCGYEWLQASMRKGVHPWRIKLISWIERRVYQAADAIVLTAGHMHQFIHEQFGIAMDDPRVQIIGNYIDTDLFRPMPEVQRQSRSLCFVGRLAEQKNLHNLIEALSGLDTHLHLYGEGPLEDELRMLVKDRSVKATFHGRVPNEQLPEAMQRCEVFILPSLYEGHPKVLLEAMACGMPAIGTDVNGIAGVITHEKDGLLATTDSASLREAIEQLFDNEEHRRRLGEQARKMMLQDYALERVVHREHKLYQELTV